MYIGTFYHTVEEKGRVSVPTNFRRELGEKPIITRGLDGCLFLFSQKDWRAFIKMLEDSTVYKKVDRDFSRLMANEAVEGEFDAQGRILVPEYLRKKVDMKKNVVFAGSVNRVELWDRDAYHIYIENLEKHAEDIAEQFAPSAQKAEEHA